MNARELVVWNLRLIRVDCGAQEALAVDAEIDRTYVSRMERGREKNPTVSVLERIANAFGVPITEFFAVPKPEAKPPRLLADGRKAAAKRRTAKTRHGIAERRC